MRPFLVIWIGQSVSLLGSHLVQFAIVWWLTRTTGSATVLASATLAALLPQILISPFAGVLIDRWSRRSILIAADSAVALATLALAILFWQDVAAVWTIYLLLVIRSAGAAFHWPTMQASTTLMVPVKHLARVAGLNQTLVGLAGIFIPPLGALAVEALPMGAVLGIDVATAIPAIVAVLFIAIPQPVRTQLEQTTGVEPAKRSLRPVLAAMLADMRQGFRFIWNWKALLAFAGVGVMIYMFGQAAASLLPILVTRRFHGGPFQFGWLQSAGGIGAVIGGVTLGVWGGARRRIVPSMLALALDGLAVVALGLIPEGAFPLAVTAVFCAGILETIVIGLNGAIGQAIIPPEMQGRVFSLMFSITQAFAPLGLLLAGPIADAFGVQVWYVLTGVIILAMGAGAFFVPAIMHIEERVAPLIPSGLAQTASKAQ